MLKTSEEDFPALGRTVESGHVHKARIPQHTIKAPDRSAGLPWMAIVQRRREIVRDIADLITRGLLPDGSPIPTVKQLVDTHGISRRSAVRVQRDLRDGGIVRLAPGIGYVAGPPGNEPPPAVPIEERIDQIASEWAERIRSGEIGIHQGIPSMAWMRHEYGISKVAARSVITRLRHLGLAYTLKGIGTMAAPTDCWVAEYIPEEAGLSSVERFYAKLRRSIERDRKLDELRDERLAIIRARTNRGKDGCKT